MWRVTLAFVTHRIILYGVALLTLSYATDTNPTETLLPKFAPYSVLEQQFLQRVSEGSEIETVKASSGRGLGEVIAQSKNPFIWITFALNKFLGLSAVAAAILLSNIFFYLFLWEILKTLSLMGTTDIAVTTAALVVIWPTSYELSLGSSLALVAWLVMVVVRQAMDGRWLYVGLPLGILALFDPSAFVLVPLVAYCFWYYSRHFQWTANLKNAAVIAIPFMIGALAGSQNTASLTIALQQSAIMNLFSSYSGQGLRWTLTHSYAGQTISALIFVGAAIASLFQNVMGLHRAIPVYLCGVWLVTSPYGSLASRAAIAGLCLQGIASLSAGMILRAVQLALILLGAFEVYSVFRVV